MDRFRVLILILTLGGLGACTQKSVLSGVLGGTTQNGSSSVSNSPTPTPFQTVTPTPSPTTTPSPTKTPPPTPSPTATPPTNSYSTNFPKVESPISEGGRFITSTSPGVNWSGLKLGGCGCKPVVPIGVTAPGFAQSLDIKDPNAGDALAVLTGNWGPDQTVTMVMGHDIPAGWDEVEIHLRTDPATGRGYEITWGINHNYLLGVIWNSGGVPNSGGYTYLPGGNNVPNIAYPVPEGTVLKATIIGNVITLYQNGQQILQLTDPNNSFTSGNPGFGFNEGSGGDYGIKSFSASSP